LVTTDEDVTGRPANERLVFTSAAMACIAQQAVALPEFARPALWAHANLAEHGRLREWLEAEVERLPSTARRGFVARLLDAANHTQAIAELAAGSAMRLPGYSVEYGPEINALTPDLLLTDPDGRRLIVEVWTRGISHEAAAKNLRWASLAQRIERLPVGVVLAADAAQPEAVTPPDQHERGRITAALKRWLLSTPFEPGAAIVCERLVFRMVDTTSDGHAKLLPIRESVTADRKDVVEAIERKVKKYQGLINAHDLPFVVVLSADAGTGLSYDHVDSVLAGKNPISMVIPTGGIGPFDSGTIEMRQTEAPPIFDPALSAVAWLEVGQGIDARLALWELSTAARPVRTVEIPVWERE
jgi:hypothetical protein